MKVAANPSVERTAGGAADVDTGARAVTIEPKERLAAYLELYRQQMNHYEKSQEVEWKGSFGIWTLLAAGIFAASREENALRLGVLCAGVLALSVVLIHGFWLYRMHTSEEFDKRLWSRYRSAARELLLTSDGRSLDDVPADEREFERVGLRGRLLWLTLEVGVTIGLALVFWRLSA